MKKAGEVWSRKHRRWVDRDDRTPAEKARHEKIAQELQGKRAQAKLRREAEKSVLFCAKCFASSENGSWGERVVSDGKGTHCFNCGAGNCTVMIPRWAVESIREQASWVGKRYYPHEEDKVAHLEIQALRRLVVVFPGRTVRRCKGGWWVEQEMPNGTRGLIHVTRKVAKTASRALERARLFLCYVPQEALPKSKGKKK